MNSILILLPPAFGHYHATYKLAAQLKERGYRIIYGGESTHKKSVTSQGFDFSEFSFAGLVKDDYSKIRYFKLKLFSFFLSNLVKRDKAMYRDYVILADNAKALIKEINPVLILFDIHISTLYLFLHQTGIPCIQVCTTLSTRRVSLIPPLNKGIIPKKNRAFSYWIDLLWLMHSWQQKLDFAFQKIIYSGNDKDTFLRRYARANGIEPNSILQGKILKAGQTSVSELVLVPKIFDYPWRPDLDNVFHVGPSVLLERKDPVDEVMSEVLEKLKNMKARDSSLRIVYCSLGTINYWQNKGCLQFFQKVLKAFGDKAGWFVIMAIGNDVPVERLGNIPDSIYVFKVVPQLEVLSICDVMITHGGLNTTKECVMSSVPMVVYPLSNLWDQPGNAARVVYHKIGLKGDLQRDTTEKIFHNVQALVENPEFKSNVKIMSLLFNDLNNSTIGTDLIESTIKRNEVQMSTV